MDPSQELERQVSEVKAELEQNRVQEEKVGQRLAVIRSEPVVSTEEMERQLATIVQLKVCVISQDTPCRIC